MHFMTIAPTSYMHACGPYPRSIRDLWVQPNFWAFDLKTCGTYWRVSFSSE